MVNTLFTLKANPLISFSQSAFSSSFFSSGWQVPTETLCCECHIRQLTTCYLRNPQKSFLSAALGTEATMLCWFLVWNIKSLNCNWKPSERKPKRLANVKASDSKCYIPTSCGERFFICSGSLAPGPTGLGSRLLSASWARPEPHNVQVPNSKLQGSCSLTNPSACMHFSSCPKSAIESHICHQKRCIGQQ